MVRETPTRTDYRWGTRGWPWLAGWVTFGAFGAGSVFFGHYLAGIALSAVAAASGFRYYAVKYPAGGPP